MSEKMHRVDVVPRECIDRICDKLLPNVSASLYMMDHDRKCVIVVHELESKFKELEREKHKAEVAAIVFGILFSLMMVFGIGFTVWLFGGFHLW